MDFMSAFVHEEQSSEVPSAKVTEEQNQVLQGSVIE